MLLDARQVAAERGEHGVARHALAIGAQLSQRL